MGEPFHSLNKTRSNAVWATEATLGSGQCHNIQEVEMVISEWPQKQEPDLLQQNF